MLVGKTLDLNELAGAVAKPAGGEESLALMVNGPLSQALTIMTSS